LLQLEQVGRAQIYRYPEHHLTIMLDRLHDSRNGNLSAELTATTTAPGYAPHLLQAQINLTALTTRKNFTKKLQEIYPEAPWETILEEICVRGIRTYRQGEPVIRLSGTVDVSAPRYLIEPIVLERHPMVVFAPGGCGKSLLALTIAMILQAGSSVAGLLALEVGEALYLDFESDDVDLRHRAYLLRQGHSELENAEPLYRRCHIPLADDLPAIQRIVVESQVKLVVIDSLALAAGAELEKAETAIRIFSAIRELRVATLIVAHTPKNAGENASIFGSAFFSNLARSTWELKRVQEAGEAVIQVGLYHRKTNLGPLLRPLGLRIAFDDSIRIESLDLSKTPDLAKGLSLRTRIQHALIQHAKTPTELADELEMPLNQIRNRLVEGREAWCTVIGKNGQENRWGLLSRHQDGL
jgi:hypothetical protein